jgi:hypothetical protein
MNSLNRGTLHGAEAAKDTTVPFQRFQYGLAVFAFIEINAGIGRHRLLFPVSAFGTRYFRFQYYILVIHYYNYLVPLVYLAGKVLFLSLTLKKLCVLFYVKKQVS